MAGGSGLPAIAGAAPEPATHGRLAGLEAGSAIKADERGAGARGGAQGGMIG